MPFLVVNSVTIPVSVVSTPTREYEEWGDMDRAFNRTMRLTTSTSSPRKRNWNGFVTKPGPTATIDTYEAALLANPPVTCSGDVLGGSVSCFPVLQGRSPVPGLPGYEVLAFSLAER